MYIKSITLDGFKSYGNRVEITGFDPAFNAITGLNGTGKSNILDSICFVLGITNLSNVRASSLQELIYKHGQAGITKATVSITFDNRDKSQAPIGYETTDEITITRQIVMGGKNKYLINGINVQNKRVNDLFCSVQLNVNNPHFLIMQGRITKVLNMKPPEILSMIEEAAGTSMYETKKVQAQNTIAKKDAKLAELDDIIKEDIAPKLQKLQDERSQFQEHQQVVREIDGIAKLHVSYRYDTASKKAKELEQKVQDVQADIQAKRDEVKNNAKECKTIDKEIAEINKKLDEENSSILKGLEEELSSLERAEAAAGAAQRAAAEAVSAHQRRARLLERALAEDDTALGAKQAALDQASASFSSLRLAHEEAQAALGAAQVRYLAVSAGREDAADSLQDQLMEAKRAAVEAGTRAEQAAMERAAAEAALARLRRDLAAAGDDTQRDRAELQRKQLDLDRLTEELAGVSFSAEQHGALAAEQRALAGAARAARDRVDALAARVQRCDFNYSPPQPGFDPARVHGTIARLIEVCDPVYCTALETAAGGRLYNVVVDSEVTSKLLLQRGKLQARTTIIPLNKISAAPIDAATLAAAQEIGGGAGSVRLALELVSFPGAVAGAMRWVFGTTLVCRDLDTAKRVCFHPRVRRRCVTCDGDVFDPAGTLSGGARSKGGSVLLQLQELQAAERALRATEQQLQHCSSQLAEMQRAADTYHSLRQRCDMLQHEVGVLRARLAASAQAQAQHEMEALEAQVGALREGEARDRSAQHASAAAAAALEDKVRDIKGHREREFKKAEEALREATAAAERHGAAWRAREQELEALRLECGALQAAAGVARAQLTAAAAAAEPLQRAQAQARDDHDAALEAARGVAARLARRKAEAAGRSDEVARRAQRRDALLQRSRDAELAVQQLEFNVKELQEQAAAHHKAMGALEAENPWIAAEKQFFGATGGAYDFEARQASLAGRRLAQLTERRDKLARGLNARAHTLLGKEEDQYQELLRKKRIVEADRAKLVQVMRELDEKKRSTLLEACSQVNRDFGSIFSALLPGAAARLQPPAGAGALAGLQVQVGFNGAWKRALAELSGGQRSLVALSLVLAMLRFRPAPLYVLDEVDAALDLAHTQNIGAMLRDHFRTSQFIIVSLKDGMFNNANVLFRTRFVDGMSSVQRTVNRERERERERERAPSAR